MITKSEILHTCDSNYNGNINSNYKNRSLIIETSELFKNKDYNIDYEMMAISKLDRVIDNIMQDVKQSAINKDYEMSNVEPRDLLSDITSRGLRPRIQSECPQSYTQLYSACLVEDPHSRPSFDEICASVFGSS